MRPKYEDQPPRITITDPSFPDEPWCPGCGETDAIDFKKGDPHGTVGEWACRRCGRRSPKTTGTWLS